MITLCLGFINIRKQNESKATHKTTQRHKTQNIEYHFITSEDTLTYNLQANEALVLTI